MATGKWIIGSENWELDIGAWNWGVILWSWYWEVKYGKWALWKLGSIGKWSYKIENTASLFSLMHYSPIPTLLCSSLKAKRIHLCFLVHHPALATLVEEYVTTLNTPGAVPNVQTAWQTFITNKCSRALAQAKGLYQEGMAEVTEMFPCGVGVIRERHYQVEEICLQIFHSETEGISVASKEEYQQLLNVWLNSEFSFHWQYFSFTNARRIYNTLYITHTLHIKLLGICWNLACQLLFLWKNVPAFFFSTSGKH